MKSFMIFLVFVLIHPMAVPAQDRHEIDQLLTSWHIAAANGNQDEYFDYLDENSVYIGTDSTEIWTKAEFYEWATPHFEKKKTWTFIATHREIYLSDNGLVAWFDELVDYGSGTLRGSGVLQKRGDDWKIMQYVLSLPVPNEKYKAVMDVILKE